MRPTCFLFDNGSLRPASTLGLRRIAAGLSAQLGVSVRPVSLLHSSGVPAEQLEGKPAELLEPALDAYYRDGGTAAVAVPLFFGPSAALTEYVPARVVALQGKRGGFDFALARCLVDATAEADDRVARILADAVRRVGREQGWARPAVLLTDHGSPQPAVTQVRNALGAQLRRLLGEEVAAVGVASMERRPGAAFDFNEPLLATALRTAPFNTGPVVVALQFIQPGRHAGPGGDIATICAEAEARQPDLRTAMTGPIGDDPRLLEILAERYREALLTVRSAARSAPPQAHSG